MTHRAYVNFWVRDYAESHGVSTEEAITLGMKEKSAEFVASGGEVYRAPE